MNDTTPYHLSQRSYRARGGITALNLIVPGLGLFRVGMWRLGLLFLLAPFALIVLNVMGMGHLPIISYRAAILALCVLLSLWAALYIVPAVLTWRKAKFRLPARGWSKWYGLTSIALVAFVLMQFAPPLAYQFYKPFYAPSESMAPTIEKNDKFIADMRSRSLFKRGQVIVFNGPDSVRISRIAGIPGDRIAMRGGVPILNGQPVEQSIQGQTTFIGHAGLQSAQVFTERLPGENASHRVLNVGLSEFDDTPEVVVPPDHLFLLGDNRDNAADSRVPVEFAGAGMVPFGAVIGKPMYIYWSSNRAKIGVRLDR